jgi:hypothetical protein
VKEHGEEIRLAPPEPEITADPIFLGEVGDNLALASPPDSFDGFGGDDAGGAGASGGG